MVIISYHVQASHLPSYTSSLLETVQHQRDISLSSGDQAVSVSSLLLRISSPLLSSLLQSSCPCSQSSSIVLPSCLSSALPSLVSLLYTGCASNLSRDKVTQLKLLTKELGMEIGFSTELQRFEPEILGSGCGYSSTEQFSSPSVGDVKSGVREDSIDEEDADTSDVFISEDPDKITENNNQVNGSGQKRRRKVKFSEESVENDEFSESDLLSMCPPVRPRFSSGSSTVHILVEPEDSILSDSIVRNQIASEMFEVKGHNVGGGLDDVWTGDEHIEVITVRDGDGDGDGDGDFNVEDDIAETLNITSDENAIDPFCEIEIESYNFEEKACRPGLCKICDQTFATGHDFKAHLASTHYKSRLFKEFEKFGNVCPICNEVSSDTLANMEHVGSQHEKVYEYYEADQFSDRGDINSNWGRLNSQNKESRKVFGRNNSASSRSPPLRGILKLTNNGNKEETPKSILRTPRPKSPLPQHSILKLSKFSPKKPQKVILKTEEYRGEGGVDAGSGRDRRPLLSVQDDVGEMMIDV